MKVISK